MEYKHLDWVHSLLSIKSTTDYKVGHSTSGNIIDFQDACGALASIKLEYGLETSLVASMYCGMGDYEAVSNFVKSELLRALNGKLTKHLDGLTEIIIGKVFYGRYGTLGLCGCRLGITKPAYNNTWKNYVDIVVAELHIMLAEADSHVEEYRQSDKKLAF